MYQTATELQRSTRSESELRVSKRNVEDELAEVKKKLKDSEAMLEEYRNSLRSDMSAVDEVKKGRLVTMFALS
eukprot:759669-Hanusia_phi.AAC.3